jgi:predicted lipid-binding transport protein (Tim44 family)
MDPATVALIGTFFLGSCLTVPGLFGASMLMAGFRRKPSGKRGRPSAGRLIIGALAVAAFVLLLSAQIDGWAFFRTLPFAGGFFGLAGRFWDYQRAGLPSTKIVMIGLGGAALLYQLRALTQREEVRVSAPQMPRNPERLWQTLVALKRRDDGFSRVAFLDFVQALYHGLHGWLGTPEYQNLSAFVSPELTAAIAGEAGHGARLSEIVLGAMKLEQIALAAQPDGTDVITVELEGNYTRERRGAEPVRLVVLERWRLERQAGAISPSPERMRVLACPSCGAPVSVSKLGACTYCNTPIGNGRLQWRLTRRSVLSTESYSTDGLGETVPEAGTDLPTVRDPRLDEDGAALAAANGQPDLAAFGEAFRQETLAPTFTQMYAAWSSKRWEDVRHLLTDFLWEAQQFSVRAYAQKKLTNRLDDLTLSAVEVVRVERDRYYDAVTARVFARCKDYTIDSKGEVIGGDAKRPREFSEYWTFIRAVNAKPGARAAEKKCPACTAPLDQMGSTGICGYCNAKVTTGDFGWVLATITQDEVYTG